MASVAPLQPPASAAVGADAEELAFVPAVVEELDGEESSTPGGSVGDELVLNESHSHASWGSIILS